MNERKKRNARWLVAAIALVLAMPLAAAEAPVERPRLEGLIVRLLERLQIVQGSDGSPVEAARARGKHHLTIEPGGDALPPPPGDDGPPSDG